MEENKEIIPVLIEDEIRQSYLDYAMSIIVGRALPDVRDGLKPVQRRILYSMKQLGLLPGKPFKKSAAVVGDVLGKYHPHGDAAIYDALARMAQDFSLRYLLVEGQGNFGSIDGDPPAAYRYTEVRLSPLATELLEDMDKDTVDFQPNFDGSKEEPTVFPASFPNLLLNGASGIAVGMATNIPPHNFGELVDALVSLIENPNISLEGLLKYVRGPDFPTGGVIAGIDGIREAYKKGKGKIILRGKVSVEERKGGRYAVVINEIPYQLNKAQLIEKIATLVTQKKLSDITNIKDESDRESIKIVLELKRGAHPEVVINQLYHYTPLQTTYSIIMLSLVDMVPKVLNLKKLLNQFLEFRYGVVKRRTEFELKKAEEKAHILEGLRVCIENIDKVVSIIKASRDPKAAEEELINHFKLSKVQAKAILNMRLQELTHLEIEKIEKEYLNVIKSIEKFRHILSSRYTIMEVIKEELLKLKEKYADKRRTEIIFQKPEEVKIEDLVKEEEMVVVITHRGYIKRMPITLYQRQGERTMVDLKGGDIPSYILAPSTHSYLLFFSNFGRVSSLRVFELPEATQYSKGEHLTQFFHLNPDERFTSFLKINSFSPTDYVIMVTARGFMKKLPLSELSNIRGGGIKAITLKEGDYLVETLLLEGEKDIMIFTKNGNVIRFSTRLLRPMGRQAVGIKSIFTDSSNPVVSACLTEKEGEVLLVTSKGFGKRIKTKDIKRFRGRCGKGIRAIKLSKNAGEFIGARMIEETDEIILITKMGKGIRVKPNLIKVQSRQSLGARLVPLAEEDEIVDFTIIKRNNKFEEKSRLG